MHIRDFVDIWENLLVHVGESHLREGLEETPKRIFDSWKELFSGYKENPNDHIKTFEQSYDESVLVKNISFFSMCEHHFLPFYGKVHVAYIPGKDSKKVIGVSKLVRIVNVFSRRLQIQERMTEQIVSFLNEALAPRGVACYVEAVHLCMVARGVRQSEASMVTQKYTGCYLEFDSPRHEFLASIK